MGRDATGILHRRQTRGSDRRPDSGVYSIYDPSEQTGRVGRPGKEEEMTKTELDNLLVEAKHISDGALGFEIQQFNRTALPALVAEVEGLRRCLDQAIDHNTGLEGEYNATQEAISDLANAMGIDAEARWDHDSCPNNSDMIRELIAELKARETQNEDL